MDISRNYRPDIDGLRAIAVLSVLFFHTFPSLCRGGFTGVDIFFVVSGYLITSIIYREMQAGQFSIANFYRRRVQRIFPALILVMVSGLVWGWFTLLPADFRALARHTGAGAAFASNLLMYTETGYFEQSVELKPLMHLWSLGVEEQFYLMWPLLMFGAVHFIRNPKKNLTLVFACLAIVSFAFNLHETVTDGNAAFYLPFARGWELMAGALLCFTQERGLMWRNRLQWALLGLVLVFLSMIYLRAGQAFPGWRALFPVLGAVLLIGSGPDTKVHDRILTHPLLVRVGLISYPLYLWHWLVLSFIHIQSDNPVWPLRVAGIVLSFVLAWATYTLVEKNLRHSRRLPVAWGLVFTMALIGVVSLAIVKLDWLVRPLGKLEQELSVQYSTEDDYRYKQCFLDSATQGPDDFVEECLAGSVGPLARSEDQRKLLLIWGDSLAAQLYAGLQALVETDHLNLRIAQRTAGSCPPGLDSDISGNGHCDAINQSTRQYIESVRPYAVILNGRWENGRAPEQRVPELVVFLRKQGVQRIVLVGPTPDWAPDLRKLLLHRRFLDDRLPERLEAPEPFWQITSERNDRLKRLASELKIDYLAPVNAFCDGKNCLIKVSDKIPDALITSDHDHMTGMASKYFFQNEAVRRVIGNIAN